MSSHNVASAVGCNFHLSSDHSSWPESFIEVRVVLFIPLLTQSLVQGRSFSGWGNVNCWMMNAAGEGATRSYMHSNELAFYVYHYSLLLLEGSPIPKWERRAERVQSAGQRPPRAEQLPLAAMVVDISCGARCRKTEQGLGFSGSWSWGGGALYESQCPH